MVFMIGTKFVQYIRDVLTKTTTATFSDSDLVLIANNVKNEFAMEIIKADENFWHLTMTADLKASTSVETTREYPLDSDVLRIKKVEAKFDGTNWVKLIKFNSQVDDRPTDETTILANYSNNQGSAYYEHLRNSLWLYSGTVSVVSGGLKFKAIMLPEDITTGDIASSTDLSTPSSDTKFRLPLQFHELWARRISIVYKSGKEKPIALSEFEKAFPTDFEAAMESIRNANLDEDKIGDMPDDSHLQL